MTLAAAELFERTTDHVFIVDADWRFTYCNLRARTELPIGDAIGQLLWDVIPLACEPPFEAQLRIAMREQQSRSFDVHCPCNRTWHEVHAVPTGTQLTVFVRDITGRRLATEQAEARARTIDALFNQAFVGFLQYDANRRLLLANDRYCQITDRSREALSRIDIASLIHPDDIEALTHRVAEHRASGEPLTLETRFVRPDGEVRWCSLSTSFAEGENGAPTTIMVVQDVTERRVAEARVSAATALIETIIDSAEDVIFAKDLEGRFLLANKRIRDSGLALVGRTAEEALGSGPIEAFVDADQAVLATGRPVTVEASFGDRQYQTVKVPWIVEGEIRGVIGIGRDITDRLAAEARIQASEERYRLAVQATSDAVWDCDIPSHNVAWSDSIETLLGGPAGPSIDWWTDRIHEEDRAAAVADYQRFLAEGKSRWEHQHRIRRLDGSYAIIVNRGFLVRDADGRPVRMIGAVSDQTRRVEDKRRLDELRSELIHVSRVSAMGTMASMLAHEINQPLAGVANYVAGARRLLERDQAAAIPEVTRALENTAVQVVRIGEMIRRLRKMVAHGQAQLQPVPVLELVDDALALALPDKQLAGIHVIKRIPHGAMVLADAIQIQQVLINLIRNAAEAMEGSDVRALTLSATLRAEHVVLRVRDTGSGLAPEVRDGLFTAFRSTKPEGLGVGLTICRTIVEAHRGSIKIESSGPAGTVVAIELPRPTEA